MTTPTPAGGGSERSGNVDTKRLREIIDSVSLAYKASTQGNWRRGIRRLDTIQETKEWLARMVDYNAERASLHMVAAMVDGSDPGEVLENVEEFVIPCLTGNGPTSEANAYFLEVAHNYMPEILEALNRATALLDERDALAAANEAMRESLKPFVQHFTYINLPALTQAKENAERVLNDPVPPPALLAGAGEGVSDSEAEDEN